MGSEREFQASNSEARRKNNAMEETEIPVGVLPQLGAIIPKARPLLDSQTKERLEKSKRACIEMFLILGNSCKRIFRILPIDGQ